MDYTELIASIFSAITLFVLLAFLLFGCVVACIYNHACMINQKKFISCLSDEDKALILVYQQNGKLPLSVVFKKKHEELDN